MAFEDTIEFYFVEAETVDQEEAEAYWPVVKVDISGVENAVSPIVLKLLSLAYSASIENGAEYNMSIG